MIVVDMWLTGFDVPCANTMYLDKPLAGHNLMQAIARVNRVYGEKPGGLVVDLIGLADPLADALATYANATGQADKPIRELQDEAIPAMQSAFEQLRGFFHGVDYANISRSFEVVLNVNEPVTGAWTCPVHRTEKLSALIPGAGDPVVQAKSTAGSTRSNVAAPFRCVPLPGSLKYSPSRPVPEPGTGFTRTRTSSADVAKPSLALNRRT